MSRRIELNEVDIVGEPNNFLVCTEGLGFHPNTYVTFSLRIDDHYLLSQRRNFSDGMRHSEKVFGVAHDVDSADRRLHERARGFAEQLAKKEGVRDLRDNTKYALVSLPRGGR